MKPQAQMARQSLDEGVQMAHEGRTLLVSAFAGAALTAAAFALSACGTTVAEAPAPPAQSLTAEAPEPTVSPKASAAAQPGKPPTKAFCRDLAKLLNSDAALELVAAEMNIDSAQAHAALLQYIPKLQRFVDGLDDATPDNVRSTLGQFNTNLQNKILQRTITADDLDLIKYTDDDLRRYAVTTCGQKLQY